MYPYNTKLAHDKENFIMNYPDFLIIKLKNTKVVYADSSGDILVCKSLAIQV